MNTLILTYFRLWLHQRGCVPLKCESGPVQWQWRCADRSAAIKCAAFRMGCIWVPMAYMTRTSASPQPALLLPVCLRSTISEADNMAFFTRSLQELPKMNFNNVSRIIAHNSLISAAMKNKGFKLYVTNYINNYEGKFTMLLALSM